MEEACDSFREYMQSSGVGEAIATSLKALHRLKKRPHNSIEYILQHLPPQQGETIAALTSELNDLKNVLQKLQKLLPNAKLDEIEIPEIELDENGEPVKEEPITEEMLEEGVAPDANEEAANENAQTAKESDKIIEPETETKVLKEDEVINANIVETDIVEATESIAPPQSDEDVKEVTEFMADVEKKFE